MSSSHTIDSTNLPAVPGTLRQVADTAKLGVKGARLDAWAQSNGLSLPARLYDVQPIGGGGRVARVGTNEIIVEVATDDDVLTRIETALEQNAGGLYRIEQQARTLVLFGDKAAGVFAQTCGLNMAEQPMDRIVYTRVAGVSCGIIPTTVGGATEYLLWVDYASAPYLALTLAHIADSL